MPRRRKKSPFPSTIQGAISRLTTKKEAFFRRQITVDDYLADLRKFHQLYDLAGSQAENVQYQPVCVQFLSEERVLQRLRPAILLSQGERRRAILQDATLDWLHEAADAPFGELLQHIFDRSRLELPLILINQLSDIKQRFNAIIRTLSQRLIAKDIMLDEKLVFAKELQIIAGQFISLAKTFNSTDEGDWRLFEEQKILQTFYQLKGYQKYLSRVVNNREDFSDLNGKRFNVLVEIWKWNTIQQFYSRGQHRLFADEDFDKTLEELFFSTRSHLHKIARANIGLQNVSSRFFSASFQLISFATWMLNSDVDSVSFAGFESMALFSMLSYIMDACLLSLKKVEEPFYPEILCEARFGELIDHFGAAEAVRYLKATTGSYGREVQQEKWLIAPLQTLMIGLITQITAKSESSGVWWLLLDPFEKYFLRPCLLSLVHSDVADPRHPSAHPMSVLFPEQRLPTLLRDSMAAVSLEVNNHHYKREIFHRA